MPSRPHNGWLDMAAPFIAAYKAGDTSVDKYITQDQLIYWYRPTPKNISCDSTDTTMQGNPNNSSGNFFRGLPNGYDTLVDEVFIVSLLTSPATIQANSGDTTETFDAPAGASSFSIPMGLGQQSYSVTRNGQMILSGISMKDIVDTCTCGNYNFNAYVGTLPAPATIDELQPAGLAMLAQGLVAPCPTNTLQSVSITSTYSTTYTMSTAIGTPRSASSTSSISSTYTSTSTSSTSVTSISPSFTYSVFPPTSSTMGAYSVSTSNPMVTVTVTSTVLIPVSSLPVTASMSTAMGTIPTTTTSISTASTTSPPYVPTED
jgi:hypothetical protein